MTAISIKRFNARRDANEHDVIQALYQVGARILKMDTVDLLVLFRGKLFMLDVKTEHGTLTANQKQLIGDGWPVVIVYNSEEALKAIGATK